MATPTTPLTTDNPYGLEQLWAQGDFVARGTLILLLIMSALSWWVMITKAWDQRRLKAQAKQAERDFWGAGSLKQAIETLKGKDNAFRAIAEDGMRATQHHEGRLTDQVDLHEWISQGLQRSLDSITNYLQGGLPILATVGSTAPFVGLFGTVWGIYHARNKIIIEKLKYFATDMLAYLLSGARVGSGDVTVKAGGRPVGATAAARS